MTARTPDSPHDRSSTPPPADREAAAGSLPEGSLPEAAARGYDAARPHPGASGTAPKAGRRRTTRPGPRAVRARRQRTSP
ncbi:hypothetical protein GA0115240_102913 [Streptomyces sp. DvalAA-14]|nr:hypothetical protein GA0115240_102913 [Streptomyces sp. DvalAA-14]